MLRTIKSPQIAPRLIAAKVTTTEAGNIRVTTPAVGGGDIVAATLLQDGNPSMVFDGSDDVLVTDYAPNPTGGFSAVAVARNTTGAAGTLLGAIPGTASNRLQFSITSQPAIQALVYDNTSEYIGRRGAVDSTIVGNIAVYVFTYDGTDTAAGIKVFKNGVQVDTTDINAGTFTAPTAGGVLTAGGTASAGNKHPGDLPEFAMWSRELTATEVSQISSHLMNKYQIVGSPLGSEYTLDLSTIADLEVWANAESVTQVAGLVSAMEDLSGNAVTISQGTGAAQPRITRSDAGENRLTYSEDFSNAAWTKTRLLATPAKVGTFGSTGNPFFSLIPNTDNNTHLVSQAFTLVSGTKYLLGFKYKSVGALTPQLRIDVADIFTQTYSALGVSANVAGAAQVNQNKITDLGSGWYQVEIAFTSNASASNAISLRVNDSAGTDSFVGAAGHEIHFGEVWLAVGTGGKKYTPTVATIALASPERREEASLPLAEGFSRTPVMYVQPYAGQTAVAYWVRGLPTKTTLPPINIASTAAAQVNSSFNLLCVGHDSVDDYSRSLLSAVKTTADGGVVSFGHVSTTGVVTGTRNVTCVKSSTSTYTFTLRNGGQRACKAFVVAATTNARTAIVTSETATGFVAQVANFAGSASDAGQGLFFAVIAYYNPDVQAKMRRVLQADQRKVRLLTGLFTGGATPAVVGGGTDFTIAQAAAGTYDVTFTKPFARVPTVFPQCYNNNANTFIDFNGTNTTVAKARVRTVSSSASVDPTHFSVIVIGSDDTGEY